MSDLIKDLNEDLRREYAAAIQYIQHAAVLDGLHFAFVKELYAHAADEIEHAKKISEHINFLGGIPVASSFESFTAGDNDTMIAQDLDGEYDAIKRYKERIEQVRSDGDYGTEAVLLDILKDEEHHANDLQSILEG